MAKSVIRLQARELRKSGLGIKTIAHQLGVSSSTVSLWSRDIKLTEDQIKNLEKIPEHSKRIESQRLRRLFLME
jgi:predicted transcriptional regulator